MNEKIVKECFRNTMQDIGISDSFYSLDGYKEGASCIMKQSSRWIVFDAERAEKYGIKEYDDIRQACLDVIRRFTYSKEDYMFLSKEFKSNLTKTIKVKTSGDVVRPVEIHIPGARRPFGIVRVVGRQRVPYKMALEHKAMAKGSRRKLVAKKMKMKNNNFVARKRRNVRKSQDL